MSGQNQKQRVTNVGKRLAITATLSFAFFTGWQTAQAHAATGAPQVTQPATQTAVTTQPKLSADQATTKQISSAPNPVGNERNQRPQEVNGYQPTKNQTNWQNQQGQTANGWQATANDDWYLFNQGQLQTGWQYQDQNWYYMHPDSAQMATGLTLVDNNLYYLNQQHNGSYGAMQTGWQRVDQQWYYFASSGQALTGWQYLNQNWYYLDPTTAQMAMGLTKVGNNRYYLNPQQHGASGAMMTGWQSVNQNWYYFTTSGQAQTGWQYINQNWYYLDPTSAQMASGLTRVNGDLYYLNQQANSTFGAMLTGWQFIDHRWDYFAASGRAASGWATIGGQSYYFDPQTQQMQTGDVLINGHYYGFDAGGHQLKGLALVNDQQDLHYYDPQTGIRQTSLSDGSHRYAFDPLTGDLNQQGLTAGVNTIAGQQYYYQVSTGKFITNAWEQVGGHWYYFNNQGQAQHGWYQSGAGAWYLFNADGAAKSGWYQSGAGNWFYLDPTNAWAMTGWQFINGRWYYFDSTNAWAEKGWQWLNGRWYYFDPANAWADTGWQWLNNNWYYFDPTNAWADTGWQWINGAWYYFTASTAMVANQYFMDGNQAYWADGNGHTSAVSGREAFLASVEQAAIDGWKRFGVLPSVTVAQAILESGWGQSQLAIQGHNLFGIKGDYNGQSITMSTAEYGGEGYYYVNSAFRRYPSNYDSIVDHGAFLAGNSRYANLLWNQNYWDVTAKLQADGYATAPTYAASLNQVIQTYGLAALDQRAF